MSKRDPYAKLRTPEEWLAHFEQILEGWVQGRDLAPPAQRAYRIAMIGLRALINESDEDAAEAVKSLHSTLTDKVQGRAGLQALHRAILGLKVALTVANQERVGCWPPLNRGARVNEAQDRAANEERAETAVRIARQALRPLGLDAKAPTAEAMRDYGRRIRTERRGNGEIVALKPRRGSGELSFAGAIAEIFAVASGKRGAARERVREQKLKFADNVLRDAEKRGRM